MRLNFTLLFFLLLSFSAQSQKLTGIWRGYFSASNGLYRGGIKEEMYKYEVQIRLNQDNSVDGVTYSYQTTVFYGKASAQGIYSPQAKSITLKETGLMELKIGDKSQPCLMTCYLDYSKIGKLEVLQGEFISVNIRDKGDCGAGKVYLEKVPVSDFQAEDFLKQKKSVDTAKKKALTVESQKLAQSKPAQPNSKSTVTTKPTEKPIPKTGSTTTKPNTGTNKAPATKTPIPPKPTAKQAAPVAKTKPGAESNLVSKNATQPPPASVDKKPNITVAPIIPKDTIPSKAKEPIISKGPVPKVLLERENNLVKTIQTDEELIQIDMYDNGTIDHDSISVFHNNKQVIKNGGLSYTPISLKIRCSKEDSRHELIMVAENLGEIPPNTALMVITAGKKRYEVFLTSTEVKNAKVVIEYTPKN
ncbi:MAG: hypothetical protein B7Y15_10070 [Bacteroidetes bacterium 24-39-8]|nr:MAG: hypothetical protein B7Y69_07045 [Sphingobacteriia bacterium 35-40-8]OYZ49657.1 MAG: hypothetical protein B7Y15_10070 [Bacteroidetes bacterium 24-39-8]OZA62223.1 MAG: hypothetical protein B7X72_12575 [Sphingobacteriia bacterium 39-39-8]HQR94066.1 hypothetical protein [Sediminibacterium sp.]HQS55329.1 hypothetical protein [Sediminibacterium sp.]